MMSITAGNRDVPLKKKPLIHGIIRLLNSIKITRGKVGWGVLQSIHLSSREECIQFLKKFDVDFDSDCLFEFYE